MLQKHLVPFAVLDKIISNISIIMLFAQATPSNQEKETTGMNCIGNETSNCLSVLVTQLFTTYIRQGPLLLSFTLMHNNRFCQKLFVPYQLVQDLVIQSEHQRLQVRIPLMVL